MLKKYLMVTSVIFHLLLLTSLIWVVPFFQVTWERGGEWARATESSEVGVVKRVSVLSREGTDHIGYEIELNGETLFLSGTSDSVYRVGDELDIFVSKHPYEPLDTLMVTIIGVHR